MSPPALSVASLLPCSFLGTSDGSVLLERAVTAALAGAVMAWSVRLFRTGHKLKP